MSRYIENQDPDNSNTITNYELARYISSRAVELINGKKPKVDVEGEHDPIKVAIKELKEGKDTDLVIIRKKYMNNENINEINHISKMHLPFS